MLLLIFFVADDDIGLSRRRSHRPDEPLLTSPPPPLLEDLHGHTSFTIRGMSTAPDVYLGPRRGRQPRGDIVRSSISIRVRRHRSHAEEGRARADIRSFIAIHQCVPTRGPYIHWGFSPVQPMRCFVRSLVRPSLSSL